ncbi:MAG: hypothetical protein EKK63_09010 [Acinetobacter sp.]|uniref:hypothetical protein n=1 Tax=Acinetobacter sp. TaxID=472 RepID=UPI000FB38AFA|nr:hypothetical protein [Acinetobacter sp.]RUP39767.1 MAG: hypothetical protein EKK63_09010 [Acinetobacter sp.]
MPDNIITTPLINPLPYYAEDRAAEAPYLTKHIDQFGHFDRRRPWLQNGCFRWLWMTSDIIRQQFIADFSPIVVELCDRYNQPIISLPAQAGIQNKFIPGTYFFKSEISLAEVPTGIYRCRRVLGSGDTQVTEYGPWMYISEEPLLETILVEYSSSKDFDKDCIFKNFSGFQLRVPGFIDYDKQTRNKKKESYRNQTYTSTTLSSRSVPKVPVSFGLTPTSKIQFGLPTEVTDLIELIFELDTVSLDGKPFVLPDDQSFEFTETAGFRLRGMTGVMETGLNRYSRVRTIAGDPNKRLLSSITVDAQVFEDVSNAGSSNAVPVDRVIIQ